MFGEAYFRDGGHRAQGLDVGLTDTERIDIECIECGGTEGTTDVSAVAEPVPITHPMSSPPLPNLLDEEGGHGPLGTHG
ncbi:hypothetical protein ABZ618_31890 [Streptomyces roseolus]|uniref:hypothetical protein n=1 Tax=Streptomyces roseolus TaxID=67358 RepID=UPI0033C6EE1D